MKSPERVLTEHTTDEITFDPGIPGLHCCVFSREGFTDLCTRIRHMGYNGAFDRADRQSKFMALLEELRDKFRKIRFAFEMLGRSPSHANEWIAGFCDPSHLVYFESRIDVEEALDWFYMRGVRAGLYSQAMPQPRSWITEASDQARRDIAEFKKNSEL